MYLWRRTTLSKIAAMFMFTVALAVFHSFFLIPQTAQASVQPGAPLAHHDRTPHGQAEEHATCPDQVHSFSCIKDDNSPDDVSVYDSHFFQTYFYSEALPLDLIKPSVLAETARFSFLLLPLQQKTILRI